MNFSDMWQTWVRVLTSPNEATFEAERAKPSATLATALIWMLIAGVIVAIIGFIQSMMMAGAIQGAIPQILAQTNLPPEVKAQAELMLNSGLFGSLGAAGFSSIITVPLGFLIGVGILWLVARILGGTGEYGRYAYLNATYSAPLTILSAILGMIPLVGCISIILSIYQIVLTYYATKVEHQLSSGKALIVVLVPVILALLLFACVFFLVLSAFVALQGAQ